MDFEYAPEHEAFRKEFRGWLAASLPPELCLDDAADDRVASDRETFERRRAWQKTMHGAGWVGINWPKEYGGRAATLIERVIWDEEYTAARTDPSVPKHQGISAFLVPMNSPGITVRPLVLMTGHPHFNEVFFSDVVVPKSQLLGPLNHGWKVSTTTLMYERHSTGARNPIGQVRDLIAVARRLHADGGAAWDDARIRQRLAQLVIDCHAMRYTRYRNLTRQLRGDAPGPEGSVLKLSGSELGVRIADAAGELLGMHALINRGTELVPDAPRWFNRLIAARQYTISAGTSEIQRNIIGERVLGLPKG
jgi:alkylation response protein AidB-like acyl-CoA dehydrogenase